jgi:Tfp pilus assembly protein PilV
MVGRARLLQRMPREQAGATLVELMVAGVLGVLLLTVSFALYHESTRGEGTTGARSEGLQQAQVAMERMTRELRQGSSIVSVTPSTIVFETYVRSAVPPQRRVRYDCSADETCRRAQAPSGTSDFGSAVDLVSGVDPTVFTATGTQVQVRLLLRRAVEAGHGRSVRAELRDGVTLRNAP